MVELRGLCLRNCARRRVAKSEQPRNQRRGEYAGRSSPLADPGGKRKHLPLILYRCGEARPGCRSRHRRLHLPSSGTEDTLHKRGQRYAILRTCEKCSTTPYRYGKPREPLICFKPNIQKTGGYCSPTPRLNNAGPTKIQCRNQPQSLLTVSCFVVNGARLTCFQIQRL